MAGTIIPLCYFCKHFQYGNGYKCDAFVSQDKSIPFEIWQSEFDHRSRHPDDNGIVFEKMDTEQLLQQKHFNKLTSKDIERYFDQRIKFLDLMQSRNVSSYVDNEE